jgi:hypothetical protein
MLRSSLVRQHDCYSREQTVSQSEKYLFCHSEFISESHNFNMLQTTGILKRVQDDNCDTVWKAGIQKDTGFRINHGMTKVG